MSVLEYDQLLWEMEYGERAIAESLRHREWFLDIMIPPRWIADEMFIHYTKAYALREERARITESPPDRNITMPLSKENWG